jgi:glycosyltransferase involved in cell wall biosynthesis
MKIIWNSSTPLGHSGYGNISKELVPRFKNAEHEIRIAVKHWYYGYHEWNGTDMFSGLFLGHVNDMLEQEDFDYIISCWDIWSLHGKLHFPKNKWIAYVPIDTEWIAQRYKEVLLGLDIPGQVDRGPGQFIAMSKHGKRELEGMGLESLYAPIGVNTKIFKPNPEIRIKYRKSLELTDDNFFVGTVGLNYADDRKGFIPLLQAFKEFIKEHPEARLYIHTHAPGKTENSLNYGQISDMLGLYDKVLYANQANYDLGRMTEEQLSNLYNTFDVFCLPTKGEGFGMPILEAAACGIPTIMTDTTTGPEFHAARITPWLISVDSVDDKKWMPNGTWRLEPRPSEILKALNCAYDFWKTSDYGQLKKRVREGALAYDWDVVWDKYWRPILKMLESELNAES